MKDTYIPIACSFYDQFEIAGVRKSRVELMLKSGEIVRGIIKTLSSRNTEGEYVILESGVEIRLDKVKLINGITSFRQC